VSRDYIVALDKRPASPLYGRLNAMWVLQNVLAATAPGRRWWARRRVTATGRRGVRVERAARPLRGPSAR